MSFYTKKEIDEIIQQTKNEMKDETEYLIQKSKKNKV